MRYSSLSCASVVKLYNFTTAEADGGSGPSAGFGGSVAPSSLRSLSIQREAVMGVKTPIVLRPPTMSLVVVLRSGSPRSWEKQRRPPRWRRTRGRWSLLPSGRASVVGVDGDAARAAAAPRPQDEDAGLLRAAAAAQSVLTRGRLMSGRGSESKDSGGRRERSARFDRPMPARAFLFFFQNRFL